jgi:hypothetical protein
MKKYFPKKISKISQLLIFRHLLVQTNKEMKSKIIIQLLSDHFNKILEYNLKGFYPEKVIHVSLLSLVVKNNLQEQ